jgi:hypothetical protein
VRLRRGPGWRAFLKAKLSGVLGSEWREALKEGGNGVKGVWARCQKLSNGLPTTFIVTSGGVSLDLVKLAPKPCSVVNGLDWGTDQTCQFDEPWSLLPEANDPDIHLGVVSENSNLLIQRVFLLMFVPDNILSFVRFYATN